MKKKSLFASLLCISLFFSCSENDDPPTSKVKWDNEKYPQSWKFLSLSTEGQIRKISGEEILRHGQYLFNSDSTFVKYCQIDGTNINAQGTFSERKVDGIKYLVLKFTSGFKALGTCNSDSTESLSFPNDESNLFNRWDYCDGPLLEYERIE